MSEKRLGELSAGELEDAIDGLFDDTFDQMPADEFFSTLAAMDAADSPEHLVIDGHVENGEFVPHAARGASLEGKYVRLGKTRIEIRIAPNS